MVRIFTRYPLTATAAGSLLVLTAVYWATGALLPSELPEYAGSSRQITGMALMLITLPSYLLVAAIAARRRSLSLMGQLRPLLPDPRDADEAEEAIRNDLKRTWLAGSAIGIAMGLFNARLMYALTESPTPSIDISLSFGQLFLWLLVGLVLGQRVVAVRSFDRLVEMVEFDLFRLDQLRPLARSGTVDVLVIAGSPALLPLQSLDAEFRWYNYSFALLIAIPTALFLLLWPLRSVHRRIDGDK